MSDKGKTYLKAIRALPEKWVHNDTQIVNMFVNGIVAVNPNFKPMLYKDEQWCEIIFQNCESVVIKNPLSQFKKPGKSKFHK